jgi:hypothetical protein
MSNALFRAAVKACDKARKADGKTVVTCPASRHAQMMAEYIGARKPCPMLREEPEHCAESILATVASVYRLRLRVYNLEAALKELHRVCASMDPEHEANRPTEAEYIEAMEAAQAALPVANLYAPSAPEKVDA